MNAPKRLEIFFTPEGRKPQEKLRPKRVEEVLKSWTDTGSCRLADYRGKVKTRQLSYILGVLANYGIQRGASARESSPAPSHTTNSRGFPTSASNPATDQPATLHGSAQIGDSRVPVDALRTVTAQQVFAAVSRLLGGESLEPFDESTKYDLLTETGQRLPPKAVFGKALTMSLGRSAFPSDFSEGEDSPCFEILRGYGYEIVPKDVAATASDISDEEFPEGMPRLRIHARRERNAAAVRAKKAEQLAKFGVLACERCGEDYVAKYGEKHASACIEVHHHKLAVSDMPVEYRTRLDDLQCLCANCHRIVHQELREAALRSGSVPGAD